MCGRSCAWLATALLLLLLQSAAAVDPQKAETLLAATKESKLNETKGSSVKKAAPKADESIVAQLPEEAEKVVVISEKPGPPAHHDEPQKELTSSYLLPVEEVRMEHSNVDVDFPETYTAVFYLLVGVTSSAILVLVVRVYRLRLSRAERKYGVQGDRANQELTPLPIAIEDVYSDEEDHTLFELVQV